jgi:hypothetical protein
MGMSRADARIEHVIHISVDGLRGDLLRGLLDAQKDAFRAFSRMRTEGAVTFNARCDHDYSTTTPNHAGMLTGLPVKAGAGAPATQQHGYVINYTIPGDTLHDQGSPVGYKPSVFDRVHDRGRRTMLLASKSKFSIFDRSYDAVHGADDGDGADHGRDKVDFALTNDGDSSTLVAVLASRMDVDFPAYTFLHIYDPDIAGHLYGWGSLSWQLAVKHADAMVGLVLAALELRPALKATTAIVITADHGGGAPLYNHVDPLPPENYTIPVMIWGPGVPSGVDAYTLFANRIDPGGARVAYDAEGQPLRNGDTGNIALALLGLPPVTGSFFRPEWAGALAVSVLEDGLVECAWPGFWTGWRLETSPALEGGGWVPVATDPALAGGRWRHVEPMAASAQRFFRLMAPR